MLNVLYISQCLEMWGKAYKIQTQHSDYQIAQFMHQMFNYLLSGKRDRKKRETQKNMCVWKSKGKVFSFFRGLIDGTISTLN